VTDERCKHDLPLGTCAFCKPTPPGLTDHVYLTGGQAFHRTESCTWLRKGQLQATRQDKKTHPVKRVALVDAWPRLEPCLHCFDLPPKPCQVHVGDRWIPATLLSWERVNRRWRGKVTYKVDGRPLTETRDQADLRRRRT
jgi:hypothetical protein